ncbi:amidohydrolase family protein [Paraburkholderia phymatum]|uniref:Amidohydrolase 2 n=1 Tax=Paraburkholderia phymatum (strain DSM 17167 / CIP 108236 / LMG 21445 / STM815) TaxID=391038 RepID=B2JTL7_PARP8|nr:amidohydrolase family protein [Paraburkholderia phymatum]ACC75920.1 amidohydrolase 2 [Paraburkholderia phymatum STM815]
MLVIDAHCHAGPGDGFTGPWDTIAPLDAYGVRAARAGIAHTLIWAAFHSDYAVANEAVAAIVRQAPRRYTGLAFVHAARDRGRIGAMVERAVRVHGFKGIKCHRADARITREVCDVAAALRIPVLYDVLGEVESVALFAPLYPGVKFIIPHLGSYGDEWSHQRNFIDILSRWPNVYSDTAGVRNWDCLVEAVRRAGAQKLLFGSDGPWLHPGVELAKVRELIAELGLDARASAQLLGGNAVSVFMLRPEAASPRVAQPRGGTARAA